MPRKRKVPAQPKIQDFVYVDFSYDGVVNGSPRHSSWERIHIKEVPEKLMKYSSYNVKVTVQRFCDPEVDLENNLVIAPIFFDIDFSKKLPQLIEEGKITSIELEDFGIDPELILPVIRFESDEADLSDEVKEKLMKLEEENKQVKELIWRKNLQLSQENAIKIVKFFRDEFGLSEEHIRVFFSGDKGFHIIINETVAGIQPTDLETMKGIIRTIAYELEERLGLKGLDKGAIGSKRRMLRLVNSRHQKSKLWKVELTHDELFSEYLPYKIKEIASSPRDGFRPYPTIEIFDINEKLAKWVEEKKKQYEEERQFYSVNPDITESILQNLKEPPVCIKFLLENGIVKEDSRNRATMVLATYFKDTGVPMKEATAILVDWALKLPKEYVSSPPNVVESSTRAVVKTIYENERYHFGCHFVRALGDRENGKAIPCAEWKCPVDKNYRPKDEEAKVMHLVETGLAENAGKFVATKVKVAGKLDTPYIVPKKIRYVCPHVADCKKQCIMRDYNGIYEKTIPDGHRLLIEMTSQSDTQTKGTLKRFSGAACDKVQIDEYLERANVIELMVVPMAEQINSVRNDEKKDIVKDETGREYEYTYRKVYCIDPFVKSNEYYLMKGYVYPHPRNASATMLITENELLNDSISDFKLTPEVIDQLKVFQVDAKHNTKEDIKKLNDHLERIVKDLSENVTRVYQRDEAHLAILLTYHSCLSYYFQGQQEKRGWLETVLVGDSGQAKSTIMEAISEYSGLGSIVSAEGASRTGLSYRILKEKDRFFVEWGKYTLSDRKLLAIDEFSDMPQEEFGKLTDARTSGIMRVDKVVSAETNARVRLVMITNPANGRTLDDFSYPVESLRFLYPSPADIRRIDLALFLKSGDVKEDVLNREYVEPETRLITSEALRNSILWAWSRQPEQIVIKPKAMKLILQSASKLSAKYGHAKQIPLCEPGDMRKKLARLSIALATLVHSTDDNHETVFVEPVHVAWVTLFLDKIYSKDNCRFDQYNETVRAESKLTDEEFEEITKTFNEMDEEDQSPELSVDILKIFARNDVVRANMIREWLAVEPLKLHKRLKYMNDVGMIKSSTRDALRKMPKLIEYMKRRGIK